MITQLPDLIQSLHARDLGHLRIVAELWEVQLEASDARQALLRLAPALLQPAKVAEMVAALPQDALAAVDDLLQNEGRLPWALFCRRYGVVREIGPGRRDRERPYLSPSSAAEALWYRALLARAFFNTPGGPEEFAFIPEDLLALIPAPEHAARPPLGRAASPVEQAHAIPASDRLLDDACTLLAALRLGLPPEEQAHLGVYAESLPPGLASCAPSSVVLQAVLASAGLLDGEGIPQPESARLFLEGSRGAALAQLFRAWLHSPTLNELRLLPGLEIQGEWQNNPLRARNAVMDFLATVPGRGPGEERPYWSLSAFVAALRQYHPDFQRPAGDYDSWYIRDQASGEFLRGFEHWDAVDGALIRYFLTGPLYWLGVLDLAAPAAGAAPSAFRFSAWAAALLGGGAPEGLPVEDAAIHVTSDARLHVPRLAPRAVRYQLARFALWERRREDLYEYRLTPASLERARGQSLRPGHLLALLRRHAPTIAPSLGRALERWESRGTEARLEQATVLRVGSPELLQALRASRAARFLGDPLGPTAVIVQPGAWNKVMAVLAEMGYLAEIDFKP